MFDKERLQPYRDHAAACSDCGAVDAKKPDAGRCVDGRRLLIEAMADKKRGDGPAIQNIPVRSDLGKRIREAMSPPGSVFCETDFSGIELHIMAQQAVEKAKA